MLPRASMRAVDRVVANNAPLACWSTMPAVRGQARWRRCRCKTCAASSRPTRLAWCGCASSSAKQASARRPRHDHRSGSPDGRTGQARRRTRHRRQSGRRSDYRKPPIGADQVTPSARPLIGTRCLMTDRTWDRFPANQFPRSGVESGSQLAHGYTTKWPATTPASPPNTGSSTLAPRSFFDALVARSR